jgi:SAM-dependent methyltransferase
MDALGARLIFLISLPRSGSTLLQHILGSHPSVGTTAEPWVLFPSAYALRPTGLTADYDANVGRVALGEFLGRLQRGQEEYDAAIRAMALHLYGAFLTQSRRERFLDKTSRYYLILPELFRIFPEARFVFLVRNPMAVLASFLDVMIQGDWRLFAHPPIRNDLLHGYRLIQDGVRHRGDDAVVVRYEDLVTDPERTVKDLCAALDLAHEPRMLDYGQTGVLPGRLVDPKSIHRHRGPVPDYLDAWRSRFRTPDEIRLAHALLEHLGRPLLADCGYAYDDLEGALPPLPGRVDKTRGLDHLLTEMATTGEVRSGVTSAFSPRAVVGLAHRASRRLRRRWTRLRRRLGARPSVTWADPLGLARRLLRSALAERAAYARGRMLDVGCGAQPYRDLFPQVERYIGLDRPGQLRLDICGDGMALPFRAEAFDTVLCNQVLEHVPEGALLIAEITRVLKPGGVLLLTVPLTWDLHLEPTDFYRYTRYGLQYLADKTGLTVLDITPTCGLWATLAQRTVDTVINNYGRRWPGWLVECVSVIVRPVLTAGRIADRVGGGRGDTLDWVMVARKP